MDLDDRITEILGSLPSKVLLSALNLQNLSESTKRPPPIKPFDLSPTGIPGPRSVGSSSSSASKASSCARASATEDDSSRPSGIKLYHLHRTDGQHSFGRKKWGKTDGTCWWWIGRFGGASKCMKGIMDQKKCCYERLIEGGRMDK